MVFTYLGCNQDTFRGWRDLDILLKYFSRAPSGILLLILTMIPLEELIKKLFAAAAVITFLTPGLRFFHEGQLEGRRVKVSMHLGRRPEEPVDPELQEFYRKLLDWLKRPEYGMDNGGFWKFARPGRATPPGTASWPLPGKGGKDNGC